MRENKRKKIKSCKTWKGEKEEKWKIKEYKKRRK